MAVTTFVLGAGASIPYGFPVASKLKRDICSSPPVFCPPGFHTRDDDDWMRIIARESSMKAAALSRSGQASIDAWLSLHPDSGDWGRLAIASQLLPIEMACAATACGDLYEWLFQRFQDRKQLRADQFRIVTFNYDRSLEIGLIQMFVNSFRMSIDIAIAYLEELPICHVYGTLGFPDIRRIIERPFEPEDAHFFAAAKGIRVMADERPENDPDLARARAWLQEAQRVVFLGFSFDVDNLKRIGAHETSSGWSPTTRSVYATGYELLEAERTYAKKAIGRTVVFGQMKEGCLPFVRNHIDWL